MELPLKVIYKEDDGVTVTLEIDAFGRTVFEMVEFYERVLAAMGFSQTNIHEALRPEEPASDSTDWRDSGEWGNDGAY